MLEAIFATLVPIFLLASYIRWRKSFFRVFKTIGVPGPEPSIITGNLRELEEKGSLETFREWRDKYGDVVGFYNGRIPTLMITNLKLIKQIQISNFKDFSARGNVTNYAPGQWLRKWHLMNVVQDRWRGTRALLDLAFNAGNVRKVSKSLEQSIDQFLPSLDEAATSGKVVNVFPLYRTACANIMLRAAFNLEVGDSGATEKRIRDIVLQATLGTARVFRGSWMFWFSNCFPELRLLWVLISRLLDYVKKPGMVQIWEAIHPILAGRRGGQRKTLRNDFLAPLLDSGADGAPNKDELLNSELTSKCEDDDEDEDKRHRDRRDKIVLRDIEIDSNAVLILTTGTVDTSKFLSVMTYHLAKNPDIQEKVRAEALHVLQSEGLLDYSTLRKLSYLEQVLLESLRMFSAPSGFCSRFAERDVEFEKLKIPKGTTILIPVYILHHHPNFWDDCETFDPERFHPDKRSTYDKSIFQPFGAGPRNCVAMLFTRTTVKMIVAKMLMRYRLFPTEDSCKGTFTSQDAEELIVTSNSKKGIWIRFEKISKEDKTWSQAQEPPSTPIQ